MTTHTPPFGQAVSYIACDVPEGMRLAAWRKTSAVARPRRRKLMALRRSR